MYTNQNFDENFVGGLSSLSIMFMYIFIFNSIPSRNTPSSENVSRPLRISPEDLRYDTRGMRESTSQKKNLRNVRRELKPFKSRTGKNVIP